MPVKAGLKDIFFSIGEKNLQKICDTTCFRRESTESGAIEEFMDDLE